jgi:BRCA1/BRCA2-containing complex subunit 3
MMEHLLPSSPAFRKIMRLSLSDHEDSTIIASYTNFCLYFLAFQIDSKKVAHISAVVMLRRSDKRKDRVEISPEQLTNAAIQADKLTHELGQPVRVLGWYHSHPHITVWPSHVGKNMCNKISKNQFCDAMKKA